MPLHKKTGDFFFNIAFLRKLHKEIFYYMANNLLAAFDLNTIIIQAICVLAICFAIFSFQAKKRSSILLFQSAASTLWMIHFILLAAYTGAILNFIIVLRNVVYYFRGKHKWADSVAWIFVFSI